MNKKIYTDSGLEIHPLYKPEDAGVGPENPGEFPLYPWHPARYVPFETLDHAAVCRFQHSCRKQ
jgi:hypothetical protein